MKPQETIDYYLKSSWLSIANLYNQLAQKYDLTQASGLVLLNIDVTEGSPATKIATAMGLKNTSLSRVLKKMEEDDLIYRQKDQIDKRSVKIFLTPKGKEKRVAAKEVVIEYNQFLIQNIKQKELDSFFKVMKQICDLTESYKLNKGVSK